MSDPFDDPAAPSPGVNWESLNHRLLLFSVIYGVEEKINTVHGVKDAVRADLVVLDGPEAGRLFENTLIFPGVLIGQLKSKVGRQVLGRLTQGEKKPGQNPPWKLEAASAADKQSATRYNASRITEPETDPWNDTSARSGGQPPF